MHPALSVILFTTLSGAGYGTAIWLSLGLVKSGEAFPFYIILLAWVLAGLMVTIGLLSSLWHLGHPERFILALSQWRSSWLSREGVIAVFSYLPLGLVALMEVFFQGSPTILNLFAVACALLTVFCTSMIYASIKAVPSWFGKLTPVVFISSSLSCGILFVQFFAIWQNGSISALNAFFAVFFILATVVITTVHWRKSDTTQLPATAESATGLGFLGKVTVLDQPHMTKNYLLKEMGFSIARKHSQKLRKIAFLLMAIAPLLIIFLVIFALSTSIIGGILMILAAILHWLGVVVSRWLFFAEAKHTVMLYYGDTKILDT